MLYKFLNQRHPCYDEQLITQLDLLYRGGSDLQRNASLFLPKEDQETDQGYKKRLALAAYVNYLAKFVNDYKANVGKRPLAVFEAADDDDASTPGDELDQEGGDMFRAFAEDADLNGHSLSQVLLDRLAQSMVQKRSYLGVDYPEADDQDDITSLADEEKTNRPYTYNIDPLSVIDWETDDQGCFAWVVLRREFTKRLTLDQARDKKTIQFKCWERSEQGAVTWTLYEKQYDLNVEPKDEDDIPEKASGTVSFDNIPILPLELPDELWIGNLIGTLCTSIFRRYSGLMFAFSRHFYPIPVYKQGSELPANGDLSAIAGDEMRGLSTMGSMRARGFAITGPNDEIYYAEPDGHTYEIILKQLKEDIDQLHSVINQMGQSVTAHQSKDAKSGDSKRMDRSDKEITLTQYGQVVKEFAVKLYSLIEPSIKWQAQGMSDYQVIDRATLQQEIANIPELRANFPSPTFLYTQLQRLVSEVDPNLTPHILKTIQDELQTNIDAMPLDEHYQEQVAPPDQGQDPTLPTQTPSGKQAAQSPQQSDGQQSNPAQPSDPPAVNQETGNKQAPETSHLQTGQHIDWQSVRDSIKEDYKPTDMDWMRYVPWRGPVEVPLSSIDDSLSDLWRASQPGKDGQEKVAKFADRIADKGQWKPVILVNTPHNDQKMQLIDGRHRFLAAKQLNMPVLAYVGDVGSVDKDTDHMTMHRKQVDMSSGKPNTS